MLEKPAYKPRQRITIQLDERTANALNRLEIKHGYGFTHSGRNVSLAIRQIVNAHNANSIRTLEKINDHT